MVSYESKSYRKSLLFLIVFDICLVLFRFARIDDFLVS